MEKRTVIFFGYSKNQGITHHLYNMASAINKYHSVIVVYVKDIEQGEQYVQKLQKNNIECVDIKEMNDVIRGRFKSVPLIFHCNGFAHVLHAKKIKRLTDKIFISMHCFRQATWYGKIVSPIIYALFNNVVDMWHYMCNKARDEFYWFKGFDENTCVIPIGIEEKFMSKASIPESFSLSDIKGKKIDKLREKTCIVCIAHFQPWKRHLFLLRALKPLLNKNMYLILIGTGPLLHKIMKYAETMMIQDHVLFVGNVDRDMVHQILSCAHLAVTTSSSETFGLCLVEPFCMDIPIITTDVGIAHEIIHDFSNGFLLDKRCSQNEYLGKVIFGLKYLKNINNENQKREFLWDNFGRNISLCYQSLFE